MSVCSGLNGTRCVDSGFVPFSKNCQGKGKITNIDTSDQGVKREAYKINWKIAVPLLLMGGIPGAIYLLGISVANCLSGRKIRVEQKIHPSSEDQVQKVYQKNVQISSDSKTVIKSKDVSKRLVNRNRNWISKNIPVYLHKYLEHEANWLSDGKDQPLLERLSTIRLTDDNKSQIISQANGMFIEDISAEEGEKYLNKVAGYYSNKNYDRSVEKIKGWVVDTYSEILASLGDELNESLNHKEIREQFQSIMNQKLVGFNLKNLLKAIPDLFSHSAIEGENDWIPGRYGLIGEYISEIPLVSSVIKHIKNKLHQRITEHQIREEKKKDENILKEYIESLKQFSDRQVLGLPNDRKLARREIVLVFRKLSLKLHPDKTYDDPIFDRAMKAEAFKRCCQAYQNLIQACEK